MTTEQFQNFILIGSIILGIFILGLYLYWYIKMIKRIIIEGHSFGSWLSDGEDEIIAFNVLTVFKIIAILALIITFIIT